MFGRLQQAPHITTEESLAKIQIPEAMTVRPLGNKDR